MHIYELGAIKRIFYNMTYQKRKLLSVIVILTVIIIRFFSERVNQFLWNDKAAPHFYLSITGQILYYLVPTVSVLCLFHKPNKVIDELGIRKGFIKGLTYGFLFTLPMFLGYYFIGHYNNDYSLVKNILFAFKDGFREEIFYRAFLFGQLFRIVKWGFIPSAATNGIIFGLSHLYQAHNIADSLGIFAVTFAGAIWFSWLFIEWKDNLWLPIFMHCFMNLSWDLFSTEETAIGGLMLNLPRILTIALSVYVTIKIAKSQNRKLDISKSNLLRQKK